METLNLNVTLADFMEWAEQVSTVGAESLLSGPELTEPRLDNLYKMSAIRVMVWYLVEHQTVALLALQSFVATNGLESGLRVSKISFRSRRGVVLTWELLGLTLLLNEATLALLEQEK